MSLFDQLSGFEFPDVLMNRGPLPSTAGGPAGSDGSIDGVINGTSALLENISPYALGKSARTGSDRNYQQIPHRFQYIIPKLFLPSFDGERRIPVSHAVDQGDIAFLLYGGERAWFTSPQQFKPRAPPCAFAGIEVVNYILLCMQASPHDTTWKSLMEDLIKDPQFRDALEKRRKGKNMTEFDNVLVFKAMRNLVQQCFVPHGICAGSEHQGGQHEHDAGHPVQAAVNFVTTMTVDGKNVDLVNYWYEHSMVAGDELIFKLEKESFKSKLFHLTKYYKEPVPITVQPTGSDNHYWQLVPAILRDPSGKPHKPDINTFWHDHRSEGYWRIAQTFQTRAQNNSVKAFNQGLPLEVTFSPVWRSFSDCQNAGTYSPPIKVRVEAHDMTIDLTAEVHPKKIIWKYDKKDIFTLELKKNKYHVTTIADDCRAFSQDKDVKVSSTFDKKALDMQFIIGTTTALTAFTFQPGNMNAAMQEGSVSATAPFQVLVPITVSGTPTTGVAYHVKMKIEGNDKSAGFLHNFTYEKMHVLNNNLWHGHTVVSSITLSYINFSNMSIESSQSGGSSQFKAMNKIMQSGDVAKLSDISIATPGSGKMRPPSADDTVRRDNDRASGGKVSATPESGFRPPSAVDMVRRANDRDSGGKVRGAPTEEGKGEEKDGGIAEDTSSEIDADLEARFPTAASFGLAPSAPKKQRKTLRFLSDSGADAKAQGPAVSTADSGR